MWLSLSQQTVYFLWSPVVGACFGFLYDLLWLTCALGAPKKGRVIATDILFCALCGLITSLFSIPFNNGTVRVFMVFGEGLGFLLYRLTLSPFIRKAIRPLFRLILRIIKNFSEILKKTYVFLLKITNKLLYNVTEIIENLQHIVIKYKKEREDERKEKKTRRRARSRNKGDGRAAG